MSCFLLEDDNPQALCRANGITSTDLPSWATNWALPSPYAQLKLAAASHVVIRKNEGAGSGRNFGIEELVDGLYVVGDTLEECLELEVVDDVVGVWLAERDEVRSWEQGNELGIVWDCPPRV